MENSDSTGVILAAGLGKRMQSGLPKALSAVGGKPMLQYLIDNLREATNAKPISVVGHGKEEIIKTFGDKTIYVTQEKQLGTANALLAAKDACANAKRIAVFYGDHPFVSKLTMEQLLEKSRESGAEITLATSLVPNFENEYKVFLNFARILRDKGRIVGIREYQDASVEEKNIKEVNPGYYVFKSQWLWPHLAKIKNNNAKGEYYLTDLLHMAAEENLRIEDVQIPPREAMGANSKEELEILERFARQ